MSNTFEQGWAARPFKEQFPGLPEKEAARLDRLNHAITDMVMADLITHSQCLVIRGKRFPKLVSEVLGAYRDQIAAAQEVENAPHPKDS